MTPAQIRKLRQSLGETQPEFANRIGCSKGLVSLWENGLRTPSPMAMNLLGFVKEEAAGEGENNHATDS